MFRVNSFQVSDILDAVTLIIIVSCVFEAKQKYKGAFYRLEWSIWNIVKKQAKCDRTKTRRTGRQDQEALVSAFLKFFDHYYQSFISERETGHWIKSQSLLLDFYYLVY